MSTDLEQQLERLAAVMEELAPPLRLHEVTGTDSRTTNHEDYTSLTRHDDLTDWADQALGIEAEPTTPTSASRRPAVRHFAIVGSAVVAATLIAVLVIAAATRAAKPTPNPPATTPIQPAVLDALEDTVGCIKRIGTAPLQMDGQTGFGSVCYLPSGGEVSFEVFPAARSVALMISSQKDMWCYAGLTAFHGTNWIIWVIGNTQPLPSLSALEGKPLLCQP